MALKLDYPFSFDHAEAIARMQALTSYWHKRYGIQVNWDGDGAKVEGNVKGIKFKARFLVETNRISGEADVGFLAEKLGAKTYLEKKMADYFSPSNSLESLQARI